MGCNLPRAHIKKSDYSVQGGDLESFNLNTLEHVVPDQLSHSYAIAFLRRVDITILVA